MPTPHTYSDFIFVNKTGFDSIDPLIFGFRWKDPIITYSFPDKNSAWNSDIFFGYGPGQEPWSPSYAPLSLSNQTDFEISMQQWENVANIAFKNITESTNAVGDIRVAYTEVNELSGAEAWVYPLSASPLGGDIWINATSNSATKSWTKGSYSFLTISHEIGHALGLDHPFEDSTFPVSLDTMSLTIMSYSAISGSQSSYFDFYPTTPMPLDIQAIQYIYGANDSFHSEDNIYTYSDITTYHETIWDSAGIDTINYTGDQTAYIQLDEGAGSSIGNPVSAIDHSEQETVPNIWIAFDTVIENASGGSNDDVLIGNQFDNVLSGNSGNDVFIGTEGNDTFQGGTGIDQVVLPGEHTEYTVNINEEGFTFVQQIGINKQDKLNDIERLLFDNIGLALDIDGQAGEVAKLLGVVFGPESINNMAYVRAGLSLLDEEKSIEQLTMTALNAAGVNDVGEVITLLWHNLFGNEPTSEEKQFYLDLLNSESLSTVDLTVLAADSIFNAENINFVGLQQTGIEFII